MRASIVLIVVVGLLAAGQANVLDDLKEKATAVATGVLDDLKNAATSILGDLIGKLGKREVGTFLPHLKSMNEKLHELFDNGKHLAASAFGKAMDKLKEISQKFHERLASLTDAKDVNDAVDDVVAEHHVEQKRFLLDTIQKAKEKLAEVVQSLKDTLSGGVAKRTTLSEHLQNIGTAISSAVSPFKDIVAGLGNTLKGHFSNLVDTVKGHVNALKGKLSGHVEDLKTHGNALLEHGKNALGALSEAVSDILKQTLSNAQPAIDGIGNTINSAVDTIGKHFTGADQTN
ncbi:uncharacterized protein [Watersipora subatra]|uniref:uncharacterized protein n=1 Tax=Watersipora subatra TaxID=2589382 RepID=UPI00355B0000